MKIYAFGCSQTAGFGLSDYNITSPLSWPAQLEDITNVPVVNTARSGKSNTEIVYDFLTTEFESDDIAIIQWTHSNRDCVFLNNGTIKQLGAWSTDIDVTHLLNFYSNSVKTVMNIKLVKSYAEHNGITLYDTTIDKFPEMQKAMEHFNFKAAEQFRINLLDYTALDWAPDGLHFGPKTHSKIAQLWLDTLKEDGIV